MTPLWNKEEKPSAFSRTQTVYCTIPISDLIDRAAITPEVKHLIENLPAGVWLAGSWFESLFRNETPKDFDLFFRDSDAFEETIDMLRDPEIPENEEDEEDADSFLINYELPEDELLESLANDNKTTAITLKHKTKPSIQLIRTRFYSSPEDVIDSFDFTVCQFAASKEGLTFSPMGLLDMARKRLVLHRITFPSSTMRRMLKYAKKGYYACGGQLVSMVEQIKNAPDENVEVLYVD